MLLDFPGRVVVDILDPRLQSNKHNCAWRRTLFLNTPFSLKRDMDRDEALRLVVDGAECFVALQVLFVLLLCIGARARLRPLVN